MITMTATRAKQASQSLYEQRRRYINQATLVRRTESLEEALILQDVPPHLCHLTSNKGLASFVPIKLHHVLAWASFSVVLEFDFALHSISRGVCAYDGSIYMSHRADNFF